MFRKNGDQQPSNLTGVYVGKHNILRLNEEMLRLFLKNAAAWVFSSNTRHCSANVFDLSKPVTVNTRPSELSAERKISKELIVYLEAISLVNFGDEKGIKIVEDAISYADQLKEVDTEGIEPLYSVLENESLYLREDNVRRDVSTIDLLSHSEKTFEDYYVVPGGNVIDVTEGLKQKLTPEKSEKTEKASKV